MGGSRGGLRFFPPIPSWCWSGRFEVGGNSALCRRQRASGMLARAWSSRAGLFALGRSEAPSVYSGGRHAECSALPKAAQAQPLPLLIPATSGDPMRAGGKCFRTRPFSKLHTLIYSVRWVKNRFRQTSDPRSQGSELKSSFSTP